MPYQIITLARRTDLDKQVDAVNLQAWPRFMLQTPVGDQHWGRLFEDFRAFQVALCDADGTVVAAGHTIPIVWDGTTEGLAEGWDAVFAQAIADHAQGRTPNALSALSATILRSHQGQGLSRWVLKAMRAVAAQHGFTALIAPVRPSLKSSYPLTPFARYVAWTQADGAPFDPWVRTHWRLGARILRLAPQSMLIPGTVAQWEEWTQMPFPDSGDYVIPGALQPITIDREQDRGRYYDPNVWMRHPVTPADADGVLTP